MYVKIENGSVSKYPYSFVDLRNDNPNTSFPLDAMEKPDIRSTYGFEPVTAREHTPALGHNANEVNPTLVNNVWTQTWEDVLKSPSKVKHHEKTLVEAPQAAGKLPTEVDPVWNGSEWVQTWVLEDADWLHARLALYNVPEKQLEFITENGLEAWQAKVAQIKADHPKRG
jgi:hypothetical protein|tara:strand:+ start:115 stop:624 length:510 start_codon:yes stop_codon:yes gene_type:complete